VTICFVACGAGATSAGAIIAGACNIRNEQTACIHANAAVLKTVFKHGLRDILPCDAYANATRYRLSPSKCWPIARCLHCCKGDRLSLCRMAKLGVSEFRISFD